MRRSTRNQPSASFLASTQNEFEQDIIIDELARNLEISNLDNISSDDEEEFDMEIVPAQDGFFKNLFDTIMVSVTSFYWFGWMDIPIPYHSKYPLQCTSKTLLFVTVVTNILSAVIFGIAVFEYWSRYSYDIFEIQKFIEIQDWNDFSNEKVLNVLQPFGVGIVLLYGILHFYKPIVKLVVIGAYIAYRANVLMQENGINVDYFMKDSVNIIALDPNYAHVGETIKISIEGYHLEHDANISWVPFWRCTEKEYSLCDKVAHATLNSGVVTAKFMDIDEYIPCYQSDSTNRCFSNIKFRVKDPKSVPGWSLN